MKLATMRSLTALIVRLLTIYFVITSGFYGFIAAGSMISMAITSQAFSGGAWPLGWPALLYLTIPLGIVILVLGFAGVGLLICRHADRLAVALMPQDGEFESAGGPDEAGWFRLMLVAVGLWFIYQSLPTLVHYLYYFLYQRHSMLDSEWRIQLDDLMKPLLGAGAQAGLGIALLLGRRWLTEKLCRLHQPPAP